MSRRLFVFSCFLTFAFVRTGPVAANCPPGGPTPCLTVSATVSPTSGLFGTAVTFSCSVSDGTPPYRYNWALTDSSGHTGGDSSSSSAYSYTFPHPGSYFGTCTVTDSRDAYGSAQVFVTIFGLTVSAVSSASVAVVGEPIQFACSSTNGVGAVSYQWSINDGFTTNTPNFTHSFAVPGRYEATCVATDSLAQRAASTVDLLIDPVTSIYFPAAASIHGNAGTFFHTDAWITNHSASQPLTLKATYYCFVGANCYGVSRPMLLAPRETRLVSDIVASLLGAPESAGPIQFTYDATVGPVTALARVYSPSLPAPTYGGAFAALPLSEARTKAFFAGLGSSGGDFSTGFRSNAGIFNPSSATATVSLTLYDATGVQTGSPVVLSVSSNTAQQVNDIFAAAGLANTVTLDHVLIVTSSVPVFPYVTVIDNQSGDFVYVPPALD